MQGAASSTSVDPLLQGKNKLPSASAADKEATKRAFEKMYKDETLFAERLRKQAESAQKKLEQVEALRVKADQQR